MIFQHILAGFWVVHTTLLLRFLRLEIPRKMDLDCDLVRLNRSESSASPELCNGQAIVVYGEEIAT